MKNFKTVNIVISILCGIWLIARFIHFSSINTNYGPPTLSPPFVLGMFAACGLLPAILWIIYAVLRKRDKFHETASHQYAATKTSYNNQESAWLHPTDETTTGETLVDSKTNTPSAEKANLSKSQELDNKLNQLEELLRSGILTEFEFEEKSKTVKFDFRSSIAAKKIGAIKEGQIKQVQSALATGVLSEVEAQWKIKLIDARFVCAYCAHTTNTISENCPNCERDASGRLPEDVDRFCCERCGFESYEDFESCQLCLDSAIIPKNEPEVANDHSWKKDYSILDLVIITCALVGIAVAILMMG